ncbi:MAG: sigma-70 family RNA polymerase sigma factor [Kofleriaceae bacterium]
MSEQRTRVVVVDDDVLYLRSIKRALTRRACPVDLVTFVRGDDAVAYLAANDADAVFLDLRMPGLDGIEACRQIKAQNPSLWVAIASAHMSLDAREATLASGADRAIAKPYDLPALLAQRDVELQHGANAVELLSADHIEMARNIAGSLARRYDGYLSAEDIDGLALLGLCEAAARYDASKNGLFIAYAATRIRGAVLDEVRKVGSKSRTDYQRARRISAARRALTDNASDTSDVEVAAMIGVAVDDLQKVRASWIRLPTQEMRSLPGDIPEMQDVIEAARQRAQLMHARAGLAPEEAEVIRRHYDVGESLAQIAVSLGLPERRVIQLHTKGLTRLRAICTPMDRAG